jgi:ABC-type transport system involved in multi-copper enzyme maturation permease subunit
VVYVGARDYSARLSDYSRLMADRQQLAAGPAGKAVRGVGEVGNRLDVLRAIRAPEPLSALVRGLDGGMPVYWNFEPTGIKIGPSAARPHRLADVLGSLDFEFLVRVVLGLLAILLAFDAVAGEKELGTLRAVLCQPVARSEFLAGKLAGGTVTLLVALMTSFLLLLLVAPVFEVSLLGAEMRAKLGLLFLASLLYVICFYALGLLASSLAGSQKTCLVVLLILWVVTVLAVTPLSTIVAQAAAPLPLDHVLQTKKTAIHMRLGYEAGEAMGKVYGEFTGFGPNWHHSEAFKKNEEAINQRIAPIMAGYIGQRRRFVGEIEQDAERRSMRQNDIANYIALLSPAAAMTSAAANLAGTGDATLRAWLQAIRRQQANLDLALFGDPPRSQSFGEMGNTPRW